MKLIKQYKPREEQASTLDYALQMVNSVPYKVSLRWLFYRLLQNGIYSSKDDYSALKHVAAKARKTSYNGWNPSTLSDDTRQSYIRGTGHFGEHGFLDRVGESQCTLDKWQHQDYYVECWFEARAMHQQFEYYTKYVTLRPFGGDPSIPFKWEIAKDLEQAAEIYEKPIVVLYFGDLDPKGMKIPESATRDIREWCKVDFEFIRAGLNKGDELKYSIPENPDKPNTYQWEALDDNTARTVITDAVFKFVDHGLQVAVEAEQREITGRFKERWTEFVNSL